MYEKVHELVRIKLDIIANIHKSAQICKTPYSFKIKILNLKVFGLNLIYSRSQIIVFFSSCIFKPISPAALSSDKKASFNAVWHLTIISTSSAHAESWTDL